MADPGSSTTIRRLRTWLAAIRRWARVRSRVLRAAGLLPRGGPPPVVRYRQTDPRWRDHPLGEDSHLGRGGCGPTSVAMVIASLGNTSVTPVEVADFATDNGGHVTGVGAHHQRLLVAGPRAWGRDVIDLEGDLDAARAVLRRGGLCIATGRGAAPFTTWGHIIVIRAAAADDTFLVVDPQTPAHDDRPWPAAALTPQVRGLWGVV